jgi:hypothetical protein
MNEQNRDLVPYWDHISELPKAGRHIVAIFAGKPIVVYQAGKGKLRRKPSSALRILPSLAGSNEILPCPATMLTYKFQWKGFTRQLIEK